MLAPLAAAAPVFFALAIGLTLAFDFHLSAVTAATLAIVVAGAVPGWLPLARERMRTLLASCGIAWLGALAFLVRGAPTSFDDPAPLAFAHVVDADRREERWLAASFGWKLPADLLRQSGALPAFTLTERNSLGWWTHDAALQSTPWRALAPESVPAAPRCRVARDDRTPSQRIVKLELCSTRDAAASIVRVSRGAEIRSIELRGHALELGSTVVVSPVRVLNVVGARGDPIELTIVAPADGTIELEIEDADRLLPSEAPALFQARPDTRVPIGHGGDVSIVVHRERI
jgi:hypothetical protein